MDRIFDYEDAKTLCASHKQILDTIRRTIASRDKDAGKFKAAARDVLGSKVIASQIETALKSGNLNVAAQPNEKALLHAVYVCDEGDKIVTALKSKEKQQREILQDINILSGTCSPLKWFFSNKPSKEAANAAYQRLAQLLQSDYPSLIKGLEDKSKELDRISVNEAFGIVDGKEHQYVSWLSRCIPDMVRQSNLPADIEDKIKKVTETVSLYQTALRNQQGRELSAKEAANKAISPLIMERTLQEMRKQDIDILSQKRSGIRLKALRDRGYRNMADIYAASQYQLASVYGISADSAWQIKGAANEIAQDIAKTIKLKISSDERTPAATALLKAVCKYELIRKAAEVITPDIRKRLDVASQNTSYLATLKNNICWVFSNPVQKKRYVEAYQSIEAGLNPSVKTAVQNYYQNICTESQVSDAWAWMDFSQRSIEYFNLLEDLCPGVFGNDDLLYGLPEDLAREIQDQVYFPNGLKVSLRRYQEWGVKYILHQGRVLLGDEMGLGKTVQAIATMVSLRNTGAKKFLVVCPASVLPNWCKEIDKKSEFRSIKVHGYGRQAAFDSWAKNGGVAVTTYETLSALKIPAALEYDLLVVDEAHFIKNENAQRSQYVRLYGSYAKRLLYMTGTALENKVEEMLSLLQVLNPRVAAQASPIAYMSSAPKFRQTIAPVYYRRKREDVLTELPDITCSNEWCDLMPQEREAYNRAVLAKDRSSIRKVSWVTSDLNQSAKARRLKEIVEEAGSDGRKVLVFSFYLETIDRVLELLGHRCTQPINGSVNVNRRQEIIDEFEKMPAGSVLPAQIQAGGTGLNIQAASVVVICEPQLKPSIENQAISRAYRMGQSRKVLVYRLLASDTIDERIDDMLSEKQAIFNAFADISEAASATQKEEQQIDDKTFGKLIQEEIDRINSQSGYKAPQQQAPRQPETVKPQPAQARPQPVPQRPASSPTVPVYQSQQNYQSQPRPTPPPSPRPQLRPAASTAYTRMTGMSDHGAYKSEPMIKSSPGVRSSWEKSSVYKEKPMLKMPSEQQSAQRPPDIPAYRAKPVTSAPPPLNVSTAREEPFRTASRQQGAVSRFAKLEDFMKFASGNGIMVKDNREKGGCVWVKADPRIDGVIKNQVFGDHGFMYSAKSKALGGNPGWYY